ncbi:hypothetical protein AB4571_03970 [Vibrio breoganii]
MENNDAPFPGMPKSGYINKSLSQGLAKRFIKNVKTHNERQRTPQSSKAIMRLCDQLMAGIPVKKRITHFERMCAEYMKARYVLPFVLSRRAGFALILDHTRVTHRSVEMDNLTVEMLMINYEERFIYSSKEAKRDASFVEMGKMLNVEFHAIHVLARYIQRMQSLDITDAIRFFYGAIIENKNEIFRSAEMPLNIPISDDVGGMLLGSVRHDSPERTTFVAKTYISEAQITDANYEYCVSRFSEETECDSVKV